MIDRPSRASHEDYVPEPKNKFVLGEAAAVENILGSGEKAVAEPVPTDELLEVFGRTEAGESFDLPPRRAASPAVAPRRH
jgi:hypothetical protein